MRGIKTAFCLTLTVVSFTAFAQMKSKRNELAVPFGVVIGKTSCTEIIGLLDGTLQTFPGGGAQVYGSPKFYPGATRILSRCGATADSPVEVIEITVDAGGEGRPRAKEAIAALTKRYTRLPDDLSGGQTIAVFHSSNAYVEYADIGDAFMVQYRTHELVARIKRMQKPAPGTGANAL